jgi:hypothetical protein
VAGEAPPSAQAALFFHTVRREISTLKITVPHHTTKAKARKKVESILKELQKKHGHMIQDLEQEWETDDRLAAKFKAAGFHISGTLDVTDEEIVMKASLPLLAKAFSGKIAHAIEREAKDRFPMA